MNCKDHPMAPHGYLRQASHDAGRYVCECEWWNEKDYELATLQEAEEFDKKRNYVYMSPSINAQWNVTIKDPWDEWKATKDIV